ncbi:MAG: EscE/YscE/SsaE family type III secretion system needle protein co-chaperone [Candidatus Endonucleobacter bathymodioli]|uniref:EscE/YscE/SsaE family type III secretion system needle protein co-chaperone n=1 Tax=Candidatus Endonucleibacter bathymodioli TaxID=539814 RepID=A0AA90NPY2_9GAMM|nr:EscE/YscE/SsaE family type III secretion system needle protein co-chaperone [Candidatus Endonucleobacter bathymodioli]
MGKINNQTSQEEIKISELEERLIHDQSSDFRDHLMSQLFDQLIKLKNLRNKGMSPEEYNRIESLILAVSAAGETVSKAWDKHHKKSLQPSI